MFVALSQQSVAEEYQVEAMPTFLFLKEGKEVDRVVGARKEDLQAKVASLGTITAWGCSIILIYVLYVML